jgi:hypothetical protein
MTLFLCRIALTAHVRELEDIGVVVPTSSTANLAEKQLQVVL